jgi:DNA-binding response OmpR family regulator
LARVVALFEDLMLGSNAQGWLSAGGHEVTLAQSEAAARSALDASPPDVLVVDLAAGGFDGIAFAAQAGEAKTLGVYSHVDDETRRRALEAAFDLVVPRSRFAREAGALVDRLA